MKIFHGQCKHCSFVWAVADRVPNHCPECGGKLFDTTEELMAAKLVFTEVRDVRESRPINIEDAIKDKWNPQ